MGSRCAPVPVSIRVDVQRREDEGQDGVDIFADEVDDVLVVPVVESSLGHLAEIEVRDRNETS